MKRNTYACTWVGLLLAGLSLTFTACKDNDLDADSNGGNGKIENDSIAYYDKQEALTCLLGGVADLDSLPANWNTDEFAATPTIGKAADGNPHLRYVAVADANEANRIYKSLIASSATETVSNDTWTKDGIGTLKFNVKNDATCFATLDVNVKQLPTLEQIQFVPASALGDNDLNNKEPYYRLGDVVAEQVSTDNYVYWVCVRPYSTTDKKSYWCTFQLTDNNYVNKSWTSSRSKIVPTKLCSKQAEGIQMIPNLFNLLFAIAEPSNTQNYTDKNVFCGLSQKNITANYLRAIGYMWDYFELWKNGKVANSNFVHYLFRNDKYQNLQKYEYDYADTPLKERFATYNPMDVFYYGYKSIWFGDGDYKVFNLHLESPSDGKSISAPMYSKCTPQTAYVDEDATFNFREYEKGYIPSNKSFNLTWDDNTETTDRADQFIVRLKSGAELDNTSGSDKDPYNSFENRQSKNKMNDILVSKNHINDKKGGSYEVDGVSKPNPSYFAFGDYTTSSESHDGFHFCIKEANTEGINLKDDEVSKAYFLYDPAKELDDKLGENVSDRMAELIMIHLMNAHLMEKVYEYDDNKSPLSALADDEDLRTLYYKGLHTLYEKSGIFETDENGQYKNITIAQTNDTYTMWVRFKSGSYKLMYYIPTKTYTLIPKSVATKALPIINVLSYTDTYTFHETYSKDGTYTLGKTASERESLRKTMPKKIIQPFIY